MVDDNLIDILQSGKDDFQAFETIFRKWYPGLCAYAHQFVPYEQVEDVVQESMVWLWEKRRSVTIRESLQSYLYSMIRHRCLNYIARGKISEKAAQWYFSNLTEQSHQSVDTYSVKELQQRIDKAIAYLPETYRDAFLKHRYEGKTYKEIASEVHLSPKTIDYRIQQALKLLRKELEEFLPAEAVLVILSFFESQGGV